jgi:hypothetical protein
MLPERYNGCTNPNIEIRSSKQYQNPNVQNSKQKRSGTAALRFGY